MEIRFFEEFPAQWIHIQGNGSRLLENTALDISRATSHAIFPEKETAVPFTGIYSPPHHVMDDSICIYP